VGSIDSSPIVTISFFNLTLSLTNGFLLELEYFISKSSKPFICFKKLMASDKFFLFEAEIVPLSPSPPTSIVPYTDKSFNLERIEL